MFQLPSINFGGLALGAAKNVANWIDKSVYDIPFVSNPFATKSTGGTGTTTSPTPSPNPKPAPVDNTWQQESQKLMAQLAALQSQQAQMPKLPNFDILANYNKAKQTATDAVTPLYNKKLNLFLEGQGIKKDTKTKERDLSLENNQIALNNSLQDNQTSRVRTGEDLASALETIGRNADNFQTDEGTQFDDTRRAAQEELAANGGTDTGLGQQALQRMVTDRNISSDRQVQEFDNQKAAKQLLATRTIDDLVTSDTRNTQKKGQDDKATQIDFDGYIASLANEENSFRLQNDLDKALQIAQQTGTYADQGVNEFVAGLASQGWRPQDIALAKQVYG